VGFHISEMNSVPLTGPAEVRKLTHCFSDLILRTSGTPRIFFGGVSTNSGGGSPLIRGSGGSCNLVQEISFHIVKFS